MSLKVHKYLMTLNQCLCLLPVPVGQGQAAARLALVMGPGYWCPYPSWPEHSGTGNVSATDSQAAGLQDQLRSRVVESEEAGIGILHKQLKLVKARGSSDTAV